MWCDQQFAAFNQSIMLDLTRQGRIESALAAFTNFCQADPQLAAAQEGDPFLQGSVATRTAIRPLIRAEFDVDVIYPFRLSAFGAQPTPKQVHDWFVSRLNERAFYKANLLPKNRCARIDYTGDFHVDIIPSTRELAAHQPYGVPMRDLGGWVTNNPIGFAEWVEVRAQRGGGHDANGDGYFIRSIRMLKRWRDQFFDEDSAVSSMLLVTFLGKPPIGKYFFNRFKHLTPVKAIVAQNPVRSRLLN